MTSHCHLVCIIDIHDFIMSRYGNSGGKGGRKHGGGIGDGGGDVCQSYLQHYLAQQQPYPYHPPGGIDPRHLFGSWVNPTSAARKTDQVTKTQESSQ